MKVTNPQKGYLHCDVVPGLPRYALNSVVVYYSGTLL